MSIDQAKFELICAKSREAMVLHSAADTLEWDERTGMPIAGGEYRATQVSTLRGMVHRIRTDKSYGDALQALHAEAASGDVHGDREATIIGLYRDWERDHKLSTSLVE
ncbi:MAG: carboxypeptidase M32, partial [Rubripirellula sp.]